jgi:carboxyl-terminal processing protease
MMNMVKKFRFLLLGVCALLLCTLFSIVSYNTGYAKGSSISFFSHIDNAQSTGDATVIAGEITERVDFQPFWKVWQILDQNFAPLDSKKIGTHQEKVIAVTQALAKSYDDPYTEFIPTAKARAFKDSINGSFSGIGAVLHKINDKVYVLSLMENSPALASGLLPMDAIIAVDGVPVAGQSIDEVVGRVRGEVDTAVALTIERNSEPLKTISITRGTIALQTTSSQVITKLQTIPATVQVVAQDTVDTVSTIVEEQSASIVSTVLPPPKEEVRKQQYYIITLSSFAKNSADAFTKELEAFEKSDAEALIIDLRNNPGGLFDVAIDLASHFLPSDATVVRERIGGATEDTLYKSRGYTTLENKKDSPVFILINENSASASEIFAGALRDHKRATLIGTTSFGKGSIQSVVDIGNFGTLKITIARWFTPEGVSLSHAGITPDVAVDINAYEWRYSDDPIMDATLQHIRSVP